MKAVIGLGNPGARYRRTRHNVGFMLLDELSSRYDVKFKGGKDEYMIGISEKLDTAFIKPLTFMNDSGAAVKDIVKRYGVDMEDLMVVYDDLDLVLGRFKIKKNGSGGTHNGMKSIIYHLGSDGFPRLKIGIDVAGRRDNGSSVDYVLTNFTRSEKEQIQNILPEAADSVECFITQGLEKAMNTYNQRQ
ncbi:MAG: aminoacyl-tRNA hydrolase [Candidatus Marinimicrobia bacterium]|nr:aminoacyl-tRNA hydrolase [Candidatus Neomarinimicrobiota bacterium]